ncbi:hypothetical protein BDZ91DRAFT_852682 [Kalaharituber pfeilii]|nr:hypothetical protein BDZ91DRAFT_852682 [Kalaharituber pfeilii]
MSARTYDPHAGNAWPGPFDPDTLTSYDPTLQITRTLFSRRRAPTELHASTELAITIDGSCHGNGTPSARGAYGIWFGPESRHNHAALCCLNCTPTPQSNQVAEIDARLRARKYVVNAMTLWVWGWAQNGWMVAGRGRPVANQRHMQLLHDMCLELEDDGIQVQFWRVDRMYVQEADRLANSALDEAAGCNCSQHPPAPVRKNRRRFNRKHPSRS